MDEPTPPSGKGDGPVEGWVRPEAQIAPPRRGSELTRYRVAVVVIVMVIVAGVGSFAYLLAGGDPGAPVVLPWEAAPGPIEFGTGGTGCSLTDKATTFPSSAGFRAVATLNRPLRAGESNISVRGRSRREGGDGGRAALRLNQVHLQRRRPWPHAWPLHR